MKTIYQHKSLKSSSVMLTTLLHVYIRYYNDVNYMNMLFT